MLRSNPTRRGTYTLPYFSLLETPIYNSILAFPCSILTFLQPDTRLSSLDTCFLQLETHYSSLNTRNLPKVNIKQSGALLSLHIDKIDIKIEFILILNTTAITTATATSLKHLEYFYYVYYYNNNNYYCYYYHINYDYYYYYHILPGLLLLPPTILLLVQLPLRL